MNKKFSTLLASLLLASAFVGTADAKLKPLAAGTAPVVGGSYVLGSVHNESDGKVTNGVSLDAAGNVVVTSTATVLTTLGTEWTLEATTADGYTDAFVLKAPNGKYVDVNSSYTVNLVEAKASAEIFVYDKTKNAIVVADGTGNELAFDAVAGTQLYVVSAAAASGTYPRVALATLNAAVTGETLMESIGSDYYYVASNTAAGGASKYLKYNTSTKTWTVAATRGASAEEFMWKISASTVNGYKAYKFTSKANPSYSVTFMATQSYENGFNLYADLNCATPLTDAFAAATTPAEPVIFGVYQTEEFSKKESELNAILGNGFELTIDTEKDADATIEGIAAFEGTLKADDGTTNDVNRFKLTNGSKVVVLNKDAKWGAENVGVNKRGYKFELVSSVTDATKQYAWFEFVTNAGAADSKQVNRIDVYDKATAGTKIGSLYIITIDGKNYLTTSVSKDTDETWPYLYLGSDNIVKVKDLVGKFWTIKYADTRANARKDNEEYKYKGILVAQSFAAAANSADYVLASTVYANAPEAQWGVTNADLDNNSVELTNRENGEKIENVVFRKSGENYIMTAAAGSNISSDLVSLTAVSTTEKDGYAVFTESELKNSNFYLGQYHAIEGNNHAYFVENHASSHQIGLTAVKENADKWNLKLATRKVTVSGVDKYVTDTVYVYTNLLKLKSDGTKDSKATETHIAILPYVFQKAANKEFMMFNDANSAKYYYCDPEEDNANDAARFALKMKADGSYNFVEIKNDAEGTTLAAADVDELADKKVRVANSLDKGSLKTMALYSEDDNSLMVVEKAEAPEYHKIAAAWGDTIQLARANNTDQVIYEQADAAASKLLNDEVSFLNIENVNDPKFAGLNGAIFADTAYINREGNTTWQYLLAVKPSFGYHKENCNNPAHEAEVSAAVDTVYGNFLVNLIDTANLYAIDHLHNNPYLTIDNTGAAYAKLSFVPGFHTNDTLYIVRASGDTVKLGMGTEDFNVAKFAFRYVDQDAKSFKIQTQYKEYVVADSEEEIAEAYADGTADAHNEGYLAWVNGVLAVVEDYEAGDVFTIAENVAKAPTANDAIAAEAGVQVVAGKGTVTVQGAAGKVITVANILGQTIANQVATSDNVTIAAPAGVVVVAVEGEATKVVVK